MIQLRPHASFQQRAAFAVQRFAVQRLALLGLVALLQATAMPASAEETDPNPQTVQLALAAVSESPASLQLAQRLAPTSLAQDQVQQQLLQSLHAILHEHPEVRKAHAALESAGHDTNTARGARWPSFKVGTSTGDAQLRNSRQGYTTVNAEVRMSLLDGGAIGAGIRSAEFQEAAQTNVLFGTQQNVLLEALTAMQELRRQESKSAIAAESARIIGQLAHIEERRAELGAVGRNDLRQAASRQASALAQRFAIESLRVEALARFTRYFGFTPAQGDLPDLLVPRPWMPSNEGSALQAAEAQSPELQEIGQQIERARAEIERSKAQRFPTLAAVVAHNRDPKGVLLADGTRYGVELNWNFGNGFELRDRILKAINELQAQEAQQESVRRQIRETAATAWGRAQTGQQREDQLGDAVREARAAFEGRRRLLEVGRGSLAQVLDAQLDMQRLMLEQADAIYDQHINELRLVRTTGQLLPQQRSEQWLHQLFAQHSTADPASPIPAAPSTPTAPTPLKQKPQAAAMASAHRTQPDPNVPRLQLRLDAQLHLPSESYPITTTARW